jgi:hypothetical protein
MLSQIPGISSSISMSILAEFKTLPNLIKCIQLDKDCMNNICTVDTKGKHRKISKSAIANIILFLQNE